MAGGCRWGVDLPGLSEGHRYACRFRLQIDSVYIRIFQSVALTIAIIPCRVASAAGEDHPRWNCQKHHENKRQIPPHESSPSRPIEPRNGLCRMRQEIWVKSEPGLYPAPARSRLTVRGLPAFGIRPLHAAGRQNTLDLLQRKVYQGGMAAPRGPASV